MVSTVGDDATDHLTESLLRLDEVERGPRTHFQGLLARGGVPPAYFHGSDNWRACTGHSGREADGFVCVAVRAFVQVCRNYVQSWFSYSQLCRNWRPTNQ